MATRRERVFFELTATDGASRVFRQVEGSARGLASGYDQIRNAVGLIASGAFVRSIVDATKTGEEAQLRLSAALRATGNAIGYTRAELDEMADTMALQTLFDDDALRNAQAQLVKFGNIHGQVFRRAMEASADLASFMGTDVASAAQQVGRALQSPTEGVTLLERTIGKLTEAEEEHIRKLAEQGQAVEAQEAVLKVLQDRLGGTAEGMNQGLGGALAGVTKAWDDFLEALGRTPAVSSKTTGFLGFAEQSFRDLKEIIEHGDWVEKALALAAFAGGWRGFKLSRDPDAAALASAREDQERFEAGLRPARKVELGGTVGKSKTTGRTVGDYGSPEARMLAAEMELGGIYEEGYERARKEEAERMKKEIEKVTGALVESADIAAELSEGMVYTWDAAGNRIEVTRDAFEELIDVERRAAEAGAELGFTFTSAFEDMVLEGAKARDVIQGLGKDIARIVLRRAVTEPMAKAVTGALGGLFGGMGASYTGDIPAFAMGTDSVPRTGLALVHQGESIIPAGHSGPGITINQNIYNNANTPTAVREAVYSMLPMIGEAAVRAVEDARRRGR